MNKLLQKTLHLRICHKVKTYVSTAKAGANDETNDKFQSPKLQ